MNALTPSSEDYLEAIIRLLQTEPHVHSVQVAQTLGVSKPSVVNAMKVLKDAGLVQQEPYGTLWLTREGERLAQRVSDRHNLLKSFLLQVLGVDESNAETDACRMEHAVSQATMDRLKDFMEKRSQ